MVLAKLGLVKLGNQTWPNLVSPSGDALNDGHGRLWPNLLWPIRIWPILVFQSVDRLWPNRLWPILVCPGVHTTAQELQTCTFQGSGASKHHQNSTRRPQRDTMRAKRWRGREEKARNFGPPHPLGPHPWGPHFFQVWASHPSGPYPSTLRGKFGQIRPTKVGQSRFGQSRSNFLAKVGLAKVGIGQSRPIRMAKVGLAKVQEWKYFERNIHAVVTHSDGCRWRPRATIRTNHITTMWKFDAF